MKHVWGIRAGRVHIIANFAYHCKFLKAKLFRWDRCRHPPQLPYTMQTLALLSCLLLGLLFRMSSGSPVLATRSISSSLYDDLVLYTKYSSAAYQLVCFSPLGNTRVQSVSFLFASLLEWIPHRYAVLCGKYTGLHRAGRHPARNRGVLPRIVQLGRRDHRYAFIYPSVCSSLISPTFKTSICSEFRSSRSASPRHSRSMQGSSPHTTTSLRMCSPPLPPSTRNSPRTPSS